MTAKNLPWNSVWITGASSGIGATLARKMDGRGAKIVISARSNDKLESLSAQGSDLVPQTLDVANYEATLKVINDIETIQGPIDLAVLNAGVWHMMGAKTFDITQVRDSIEVNYMAVQYAISALLPRMIERKSGHIAIVASVAGYSGLPNALAYGPTKAALINLAESLRAEVHRHGITVSVINPGFVDTPMTVSNPFPMPGIISQEAAADAILAGLTAKKFEIAFPKFFTMMLKFLRLLPYSAYFWILKRVM